VVLEKDLLEEVAERIRMLGLSEREAADSIGVTLDSLRRHLGGEYVRSDSQAKYRRWVSGSPTRTRQTQLQILDEPPASSRPSLADLTLLEEARPKLGLRVVDLFSGCGGLSVGFESLEGSGVFECAMAIDFEEAMVRTFNVNHPRAAGSEVCLQIDLSDFINETEVRAFYLSHLVRAERQETLAKELSEVAPVALEDILRTIASLDREFVDRLGEYRVGQEWTEAYKALDSRSLGQTSVRGFHDSLRLPQPSQVGNINLAPLIWSGIHPRGSTPNLRHGFLRDWEDTEEGIRRELEARWESECAQLEKKAGGSGRGQLESSAPRIRRFTEFLSATQGQKTIWMDWRAKRDALRFTYFSRKSVEAGIRAAYTGARKVSVVLGGPPCQGFSRIGRGKIRSLRDDRVHAHYDAEAGDIRNRLFEKYVLFVGALAPKAFLFENVRHFQTEVKTPDGLFLATEILAEAVRDLSDSGVTYHLANRTVMASDHGIPQTRDRFFMAGVRSDVAERIPEMTGEDLAKWVLELPRVGPVSLRTALEDLPHPFFVENEGKGANLARTVRVGPAAGAGGAAGEAFRNWVRGRSAPPPHSASDMHLVDSHVARDHRPDDRTWLSLMGPGRRWMDYRCDGSPTLSRLRAALSQLHRYVKDGALSHGPVEGSMGVEEVGELLGRTDGSLSLRLLLESIEPMPGELGHHLLKESYLSRREGKHGDWLARLDGERPSKTIVAHMGKDTYAYGHPWEDRTLSVREAARIQSFPDWFSFSCLGLVDAFRVIGNAVPPLVSRQMADRISQILIRTAPSPESGPNPEGGNETSV
jgi:site-specific DNA-cytosine methylase